MKSKIFTLEINANEEVLEIHLNKEGVIYLLDKLNKLIEVNDDKDFHLMSESFGGNDLTEEKQNLNKDYKLIKHLKLLFWSEK